MDSTTNGANIVTSGPAFEALGLVHRLRIPSGAGPHPALVMIHGLQGTEDVTWVFARAAGPEWFIVSPRAPFPADSGYRWYGLTDKGRVDMPQFEQGLSALAHFIDHLADVYPVDRSRLVLLGFSQGTAMAYAYGAAHSVAGIAALSGFIPANLDLSRLRNTPILLLHGTEDMTIPVAVAQEAHKRLVQVGANVTYQESHVGHKISVDGMRELKRWLAERLT